MNTQRLQFEGATGARLSARLDLPVDEHPVAYALFAHCFTCSKNLKAVGNISRALTAEGIGVLRFDFTGLGESEGEFAETTFSSNIQDLIAAARLLESSYQAPKILVGHSLGGAAVLQAAAEIPSVTAVATIGAPSEPGHVQRLLADSVDTIRERGEADVVLAGRRFTIRKQFLDDLEARHMEDVIRQLDRALLVFHSPMDEIVGIDNAARIYQAAKHPKSFVSLDTADHLLTDEHDARYVGRVLAAWAHKYLDVSDPEETRRDPADNRIVTRTGASGFRTEVLANGHPLVADEPLSVGGTNTGPSPYDLLAAALGACTSMTLRMYADRKGWPLEEAVVRLRHRKIHEKDNEQCGDREARLDHIDREIRVEGPLSEEQRRRLLEIAGKCPVHRTLQAGVVVDTRLAED